MDNLRNNCVFCGNKAGSKEHIFPAWLNKVFGQIDCTVVMDKEGGRSQQWTDKIFRSTVKTVCHNCNTGWMADMEAAVSKYLGGIVAGTSLPASLDSKKQIELAKWAQKTMLVTNSVYGQEDRNATANMYTGIFERKDAIPLSVTFMSFNERLADSSSRIAGVHTNQITSVKCPPSSKDYYEHEIQEGKRLIVSTIRLGHVNFHVVAGDFENSTLSFGIENGMGAVQVISPTPQAVKISWPTTIPSELFGGADGIHKSLLGSYVIEQVKVS